MLHADNQSPAASHALFQKSGVKEFILGGIASFTGILVFWFWYVSISHIVAGTSDNYTLFLFLLPGLMVSAAFFSLSALFIKNKKAAYGFSLAGIAIPFFFVEATNVVVGTFLLGLALTAIAISKIRAESRLSLGFSMPKIVKQGLPLYFTVISLIITVFYLSLLDEEKALASFLPKSAVDVTFNLPIARALNLPNVNTKTTVDEFISELLKEQLRSQDAALFRVNEEELSRAVSAQREKFSEEYHIELRGNERVADVFYSSAIRYIERLLGSYRRYLPLAAAAAFFFAFKTLTFFLYYLTLPLIFLLIQIMIWSNVVQKKKKDITVEELALV